MNMKTKTALELVTEISKKNIREEVADMLIAQAEEIDRLHAKLAEIKRVVDKIEKYVDFGEEACPFCDHHFSHSDDCLYNQIRQILKDVEGE